MIVHTAADRGHFTPREDLTARRRQQEVIHELRPVAGAAEREDLSLRAFFVAYTASALLVQTARFLVEDLATPPGATQAERTARRPSHPAQTRAYDGAPGIRFELTERAGKPTLSAQDILWMAVESRGFEPLAVFGVRGTRRRLVTGERVRALIRRSLVSGENEPRCR